MSLSALEVAPPDHAGPRRWQAAFGDEALLRAAQTRWEVPSIQIGASHRVAQREEGRQLPADPLEGVKMVSELTHQRGRIAELGGSGRAAVFEQPPRGALVENLHVELVDHEPPAGAD